ncbi:N-formylglutamate amidohydrolase [Criblamydia sequanensis]|uniref:N-formylglutamate amidohydrolase n=1 Tax=Candidatus Criblamydia sequanensis TaxID=340071 RepID=UPI0006A6DD10|nr:N-formylglutamate amidohydrolase [Criblamydia sequanensis]
MKIKKVVLSVEHAGFELPYGFEISIPEKILTSHRGYDKGAFEIGEAFEKVFKTGFFSQSLSRLVIEMNRSLNHPFLFSSYTKGLTKEEKKSLIDQYYFPYRDAVQSLISRKIKQEGSVVHLSLHTFTPIFKGIKRNAMIGLLYDSRRKRERELALSWKENLKKNLDIGYNVKLNYPYLGKADGLTSYFRKIYKPSEYVGLELEVNQALFSKRQAFFDLSILVAEALKESLKTWEKNLVLKRSQQIPPADLPA